MKMLMFTIYDLKTQRYYPPFCVSRQGEAEQIAKRMANDERTNFGNFPEDFMLMELGKYDEDSGLVDQNKARSHGTLDLFKSEYGSNDGDGITLLDKEKEV